MTAPPQLVIAYDGSPLAEAALGYALRLSAHERFSMVHVVCVVQAEGDQVRLPHGVCLHRWAAFETLRHMVRAVTEDVTRHLHHVRIVTHLLEGEPAATLVDFAYRRHATGIFLGARGQHARNLAVGRVAEEVLALSDIPVHLETALPTNIPGPPSSRSWGHQLRGQSLFGPQLPPWRSPATA